MDYKKQNGGLFRARRVCSVHAVESFREGALFARGVVLVDKVLTGGLVDLLDGVGVAGGSGLLVAGGDGGVELLDAGTQSGPLGLVGGVLNLAELNALLGGLDIGQMTHLPKLDGAASCAVRK